MDSDDDISFEVDDDLAAAIEGISAARAQGRAWYEQWQRERPDVLIPPMIPAADGRGSLLITPEGYGALVRWANRLYDGDAKLRAKLTAKEWRDYVHTNLVATVQNCVDEAQDCDDVNGQAIQLERPIRRRLKAGVLAARVSDRIHIFPARFASKQLTKRLDLGPVHLVPVKNVKTEIRKLLPSRSKASLQARNDAFEIVDKWAEEATGFIRVDISGLGSTRSAQWARAGARLASTALLLPFGSHIVRHACLLDEATRPLKKETLAFQPGVISGPSWSAEWPSLDSADTVVDRQDAEYPRYKAMLSRMLDSYLGTDNPNGRRWLFPTLGDSWLTALHWYQRALSAELDFEAVVYFSIALDVLSDGGKEKGILELARCLMRWTPDQKIFPQSPNVSLRSFVRSLYSSGRSRIVHGTHDALREDYALLRSRATGASRYIVPVYAWHLMQYESSGTDDSLRSFLDFIRADGANP